MTATQPEGLDMTDEQLDAAITACALMIKGICLTKQPDSWTTLIEARIRFMLDSNDLRRAPTAEPAVPAQSAQPVAYIDGRTLAGFTNPWIAHWAGSNPYKGWSIRQGRDEVIWFGETISSETVEGIVLAHNKCFDCEGAGCVMNCSGLRPAAPAQSGEPCTHDYVRSDRVCTECGETAVVLDDERADSLELARSLWNEWLKLRGTDIDFKSHKVAIELVRYAIDRAASPQPVAQPVERTWAPVISRDFLGQIVREAWVKWAKRQPNPKPSWLAPYDELSDGDKEADRQIGEAVLQWVLSIKSATWGVTPAQPVEQTRALTVTPAMVKAAMPWLANLHHMRKTDKESNVEEAIKAALTAARPASGETE